MKEYKLKELCSIEITDGTHKTPTYSEKGYIFLSSKNVTSGKIDWEKVMFIPKELHNELYKRISPQKDDILLAKNGTTGVAALVDKDEVFDIYVSLALVRPNKDLVLPKYLLYAINSSQTKRYFDSHLKGIGVPNLHLTHIRETPINVPDIAEQENIVSKFDKITELIECRQEQLKKLDELVKSRFVEMFGDPVTNEKNWLRLTLGDICEIGSSKRVFEKDYVPSGIPFFRTKEIVELSKGNPISTELFITEEHFAELENSYGTPKKDDLLISAVGTIGTIWIVSGNFEFYFKDGNLIQIKASPNFNSIFMKYLLGELIANYKKEMSTGTAYSALTIVGLKKMLVYDVPLVLQEQFATFVEQVDKSKIEVKESLEKLETLKKALMQEFFG